jgi:hypothetical protein
MKKNICKLFGSSNFCRTFVVRNPVIKNAMGIFYTRLASVKFILVRFFRVLFCHIADKRVSQTWNTSPFLFIK